MKHLFILGAPDPEMAAIESLLSNVPDCEIGYAMAFGGDDRVHAGNAYRAVGYRIRDRLGIFTRWHGPCVTVECGGDLPEDADKIDHHQPGDPGYGRPPADFMAASSIGQILTLLGLGVQYAHGIEDACRVLGDNEGSRQWEYVLCGQVGYHRYVAGKYGIWPANPAPLDQFDEIDPEEIVMAAAADHCLEAAYRGRCPGVDPDALMRWRIESRAAFQRRAVEDVARDVSAARELLRNSRAMRYCHMCTSFIEDEACRKCSTCGGSGRIYAEYADMRDRHVPELPEAAARENIPFLAAVTDRDGRKKVVLQAAGADLVSRFLIGEVVPGLVDIYGDPARGFAGGYLA